MRVSPSAAAGMMQQYDCSSSHQRSSVRSVRMPGGWVISRPLYVHPNPQPRTHSHNADPQVAAWVQRAEAMVDQVSSQPACMAFLMDEWADMLERGAQAQAAAGAQGMHMRTRHIF